MRISRTTLGWCVGLLAIASVASIGVLRSVQKTCCGDTLGEDQLRDVVISAENGNVAAMKRLFFFYEEGENPEKARFWLLRAANAGDAQAELFLYERLYASSDVREKKRGAEYLVSAAKHGSSSAQVVLGKAYRDGSQFQKNMEQARYWLRAGALSGNQEGILALCDMALLQGNRNQCQECLSLNELGLRSLDQRSYYARELFGQRERLRSKLKEWERASP